MKSQIHSTNKLLVISSALWVLLGAITPSFAADVAWSGATSVDWGNTSNWAGGVLPGTTDNATFNSNGGTNHYGITSAINLGSGATAFKIYFRGNGYYNGQGYTIGTTSGNALTILTGGDIRINNDFTGTGITQTVNAPIVAGGNISMANETLAGANDTLLIGGTVNLGGNTLTLGGRTKGTSLTLSGKGIISGIISGSGGSLAVGTSGNWYLKGNNTFTGATSVYEGATLTLDFTEASSSAESRISSTGTLTISGNAANGGQDFGGYLVMNGSNSLNSTQTVANTVIGASGQAQITINAGTGTGTTTTMNLKALSRTTYGTLNINLNSIVGGGTAVATTTNALSGGLIGGGWITLNGTDWASRSSTQNGDGSYNIIAATYVSDTWAAGNNTNVTTSSAVASGATTNSLRFATSGANTLTLGGAVTLSSGGILVTSTVGANTTTITGGTLASSGELIVHQNNTSGNLVIASALAGTTNLNKDGLGTLILSGNNTFTGGVSLKEGTIKLGANNALGTGQLRMLGSNATFDLNGYNQTFVSAINTYANITSYVYTANSGFSTSGVTPAIANSASNTNSTLTFAATSLQTGMNLAFYESNGGIISIVVNSNLANIGFGDGQSISSTDPLYQMISGDVTVTAGVFSVRNPTFYTTGKLEIDSASGISINTMATAITNNSSTITVTDTTGLYIGQIVIGYGIRDGTVITGISGNTITLSQSANVTTSNINLTFTDAAFASRVDQSIGAMSVGYLSGNGTLAMAYSGSKNVGIVVNHAGSVTDTFTGTITQGTGIAINGTGVLSIGAIVNNQISSVVNQPNNGVIIANHGTLITPGISSTTGSGRGIYVWNKDATVKLTGTSGVVAGNGSGNAAGLVLAGGTLWIAPANTGGSVAVSGLNATGGSNASYVLYAGSGRILLDKGSNTSLTFTIGNSANTSTTDMFQRKGNGTLIISAANGFGALGNTETLSILGKLPTTTNGTLIGNSNVVFGQDASTGYGTFVTLSGTNIVQSTFSHTNDLGSGTATSVELVNSNVSLSYVAAYALRVDNATITLDTGGGGGLTLGDVSDTATIGGLILNNGNLIGSGKLMTGTSRELVVYASGISTIDLEGGISAGNLTLTGPGTLILGGFSSNYSGTTTINSGVLDVASDSIENGALASGLLALRGGVLQANGIFIRALGTSAGQVNWSNNNTTPYSAGGGFAARGGDLIVAIGAASTTDFSAATQLVWGAALGSNGSPTFAGSNFLAEGGVLMFGSTTADSKVDFKNNIDLGIALPSSGQDLGINGNYWRFVDVADNPNVTTDYALLSGVISSSLAAHGLSKTGDGLLELSGVNTYTGATQIAAGTLRISQDRNLGATPAGDSVLMGTVTDSDVLINGGATLETSATFALNSGRNILLASGSTGATSAKIKVDTGTSLTVNGKIGNYENEVGTLEKIGTGTLILGGGASAVPSGAYTGKTIITEGTLFVNRNNSNTSLTEVHNGTYLGGNGNAGPIYAFSGSTIMPGASGDGSIGTLQATSMTIDGAVVLSYDLSTVDNTSDCIQIGGALIKVAGSSITLDFNGTGRQGGVYVLATYASQSGLSLSDFLITGLDSGWTTNLIINANDIELAIAAIPEPSTYVLMSIGLIGIYLVMRRRKQIAA